MPSPTAMVRLSGKVRHTTAVSHSDLAQFREMPRNRSRPMCSLICRRQGLPRLPWCAGVPVRRACRTGTVPPAVELIEGHSAGGKREPGRDARMPPGSRTGLRDGRGACRVPADPGDPGPGGGRQPGIIEQVSTGFRQGGRTPMNVAVEPTGAVPGRRRTGGCGCPVRRARSCHHAE